MLTWQIVSNEERDYQFHGNTMSFLRMKLVKIVFNTRESWKLRHKTPTETSLGLVVWISEG